MKAKSVDENEKIIDLGLQKLHSIKDNITIAKESRASGAVPGSIYATYIKKSKSWFPLVVYLFLQLVRIISEVMMRLTQVKWATASFNFSLHKVYLNEYGVFLTSYIISFLGDPSGLAKKVTPIFSKMAFYCIFLKKIFEKSPKDF